MNVNNSPLLSMQMYEQMAKQSAATAPNAVLAPAVTTPADTTPVSSTVVSLSPQAMSLMRTETSSAQPTPEPMPIKHI